MQEDVYLRGQEVYQEGVDHVDKIYLIKNGEFELTKRLLKPIPKTSESFMYRPTRGRKEVAPESALVEFSYRRFKQQRSIRNYSIKTKETKEESIQICILSDQDIFGYQELLEKDNDLRSCTVRCLRNNSTLVSIDKNAMISTIKKNP